MEEYLVANANLMHSTFIAKAQRLTEEEKPHYAEWFREIGFWVTGDRINLQNVPCNDLFDFLGHRKSDGKFVSDSGMAFIITQEEWNQLVQMNNERQKEKEEKEREAKIREYTETIKRCEAAKKLYTKEEAGEERRKYINLYNEGGGGYVPHFYTIEEYEWAKSKLEELTNAED